MSEADAVTKAKQFVLKHTGIDAEPQSTRLIHRPDGRKYWSVVYSAELFFSRDTERGATVDGPYALRVDDATGEVSVLG